MWVTKDKLGMDPQVTGLYCCVWVHAGGKGLQIGALTILPDSHTMQTMSRNCLTLYLNYHSYCDIKMPVPVCHPRRDTDLFLNLIH